MTHRKKNLAQEEALLIFEELNSDSDLEDIYIEPPDVVRVPDEAWKKKMKEDLTVNLSGRQLHVNIISLVF
ncbi:hypothetical protein AVEN_4398-1 [Araneus ventricosus]|uniref:Uncharacterized protein n=1 Tax=Araneus ventricosus TaxID=182803 RepID=A0A4Y2NDP3_ARAVE|nr:hypothetical protein AVEN_4398-1 [Araneus ventricosus]